MPAITTSACLSATITAALSLGSAAALAKGPPQLPPGHSKNIGISVLSSAPDQVSGGDARIAIEAPPGQRKKLSLTLNGEPVDLGRVEGGQRRIESVIEGLERGDNELNLSHERFGQVQTLTLTNHPITGPIFSGPQQSPFICMTPHEFGIEPQVDSEDPPGFKVYNDAGDTVIGYSTNCSIEPFITYSYRTTDGEWRDWPEDGERPDDLAQTETIDGNTVDFVVRVERGTINRFIYSYAMLVDPDRIGDDEDGPDTSRWNQRLVYQFQGGVAIGHTQGEWAQRLAMNEDVLGLGHAIAYSTGNSTDVHYNLQLGGETALMTKERFIERYGVPDYTLGLGGSGGAIQQYVYGQNHPDLLDAAIPQRSYPDMVTQTIHVGDCELLEHYMDATDRNNPFWQVTDNRSLLVGLNATNFLGNPFYDVQRALGFAAAPGMTECVPAWRGLSPLVLNPNFGSVPEMQRWAPQSDIADIEWTHMDDLRNIYGVGDDGYARRAVDNVGVQYGLKAFRNGEIGAEQFLKVNAKVGGWKPSDEAVQEGFPFIGDPTPANFDPWSRRNMMLSDSNEPAPRHEGNLEAIRSLYETGMIFHGDIEIPILDIRDYMEPILDMHNAHQSFATRQRIRNEMGTAEHQKIWFSGIGPRPYPGSQFNMTLRALKVMDEWMGNILRNPKQSIAKNRPEAAVDTCFGYQGDIIAAGKNVWSGILDDGGEGACTREFPVYTTSRIEAGGPITGDVFKCQLKPVSEALNDGTYGSHSFTPEQVERLQAIHPEGVCDYDRPSAGRPASL
ncbi:hypothetical protein DES49_2731 [Halospina denitrificans]|uniref:DUF6351 domain-containing protein n=1 Tax=Halospina denitrificans TaxID=332522 RepID=A0A4R7JIM9_9GAMM|nr:DUF6351 family protein [Halospina denitrificans]TDT37771.1 hypothetical protein DES49_2731 [Halospina denitrificans]